MNTIAQEYKAISVMKPAAVTATGASTGVSVKELLDDAMAILDVGAVAGTNPTLDLVIQSSDAVGGTYTTIATFGQVTAATKIGAVRVNLGGQNSGSVEQKFVRASYTIAGTNPSFTISVILLVKSFEGKSDLNASTPA